MSDKMQGGIKAGSTDISLPAQIRSTTDSTEVTGKVAADMTLSYWRQGGLRVAVSASDLAAVNSAHSDGGVKEVDATNMPGAYRVDWPDAAFATGADWVVLTVKISSAFVFVEKFNLTTNIIQTGNSFARLGAPAGASISADVAAVKTDSGNLNLGIIYGAAATGTLSTTQATTDLTGYADDQLIGRVIIWTSGACEGEATDITDYANASGLLTFTALTTAPGNGDTFKIV